MKKLFLFIMAFVFAGLLSTSSWATSSISTPQSNFEFGSVPEGTIIKHSFIIKNNGDEPLIIQRVLTG
jgi:hypothetical protein